MFLCLVVGWLAGGGWLFAGFVGIKNSVRLGLSLKPKFFSLASLEKELINVINSGNVDESFFEAADLDPKIISHINMPLAVVQDTFKTSIDDKIELIKEKHRRMTCNKGLMTVDAFYYCKKNLFLNVHHL